MNTSIQPGNMRIAHFSGVKNFDGVTPVVFDSPVIVSFDVDGICSYTDIDGVSGKFTSVAAGSCTYTATAVSNGVSATESGMINVAVLDDGTFKLTTSFDAETPAA